MDRLTAEVTGALEPFRRRAEGVPQRAVLALLAEGAPVAVERIAALSGSKPARVARRLRTLGAEFDDAGRLVGYGLTLRPTQHRFELGGRQLYTWCALDTLVFPRFLGPARVESPCRVTGRAVRLAVSPERVESVEPAAAVVSIRWPQPGERGVTIRQSFCEFVHFFVSAEVASSWPREHPEAAIVSVAEAFELGGRLAAETFGPPPGDEGTNASRRAAPPRSRPTGPEQGPR